MLSTKGGYESPPKIETKVSLDYESRCESQVCGTVCRAERCTMTAVGAFWRLGCRVTRARRPGSVLASTSLGRAPGVHSAELDLNSSIGQVRSGLLLGRSLGP